MPAPEVATASHGPLDKGDVAGGVTQVALLAFEAITLATGLDPASLQEACQLITLSIGDEGRVRVVLAIAQHERPHGFTAKKRGRLGAPVDKRIGQLVPAPQDIAILYAVEAPARSHASLLLSRRFLHPHYEHPCIVLKRENGLSSLAEGYL